MRATFRDGDYFRPHSRTSRRIASGDRPFSRVHQRLHGARDHVSIGGQGPLPLLCVLIPAGLKARTPKQVPDERHQVGGYPQGLLHSTR